MLVPGGNLLQASVPGVPSRFLGSRVAMTACERLSHQPDSSFF